MKNKKWILEAPFYVHCKTHHCPSCQSEVTVRRIKKTVNSKSSEAKNYDFSFAGDGGCLFGDVEFSFEVFYCLVCQKEITIKEMRTYEKKEKKRKKEARG